MSDETVHKPASPRVGVFDSGAGGLSVAREIRALLPGLDLLYFADQAHLPYGPKSQDDIRSWTLGVADWLAGAGCTAMVVACNTASAAALVTLRAHHNDLITVGMEPAIKPAAEQTRSGVVGVLATPGTLAGNMFRASRERWASQIQVIEQACVGWVECVENGDADSAAAQRLVSADVTPLIAQGVDTLVLGCTHFPFLAAHIRQAAGEGVTLIDPAPAVARQLRRVLPEPHPVGTRPGSFSAVTTGSAERLQSQIAGLLDLQTEVATLRWENDRLV